MRVSQNDPLTLSNHLLSSLLDAISRIQIFKFKWSIVTANLSSLRTQLSDFSQFPSSSSNSLSLDLLHSISNALSHAISIAKKCETPNLFHGKLRTQNDIDSLLVKLDRLIKDADILIRSGLLANDPLSSSSSSSSKREAIRAELRSLIIQLQIGSAESRNSAIDALLALLKENDKNVMTAVAQGVVPVLLHLLDSGSFEVKEKTVAAVSRVSSVDSCKHVLIAEGLLLMNHLLRVLDSGSGYAKQKACNALQALIFSKENARVIACRGGISSLLEICQAGTPGSQASAAGVLRNLAAFGDIREKFMEEDAVSILLGLLASGTVLAQENAVGCLCKLAAEDDDVKLLMVKEGGIECLRNLWDSARTVPSLELVGVELLRHLASYPPIAEVIVSRGFIARLVGMLNSEASAVRIEAAQAVYELGFCKKTRKEMGECGCIKALVRMLDGKGVEEKKAAAKALSSLILYVGNRKIFQEDDNGMVNAVELLDPCIQNLDKKYPVSLLLSVVHSKKCRRRMVAAGATLYLQKLVEMDVEPDGSMKLLQSLRPGKIWLTLAKRATLIGVK